MILAVTNYDAATASNFAVCAVLFPLSITSLLGPQAVRTVLQDALAAQPTAPVLLFGHGAADMFIGNDGAGAIRLQDAALFSNRATFAFACSTAAALGPAITQSGGVWVGFKSEIFCLISDPSFRDIFEQVPQYAHQNIGNIVDETSAQDFIGDFVKLTHQLEAQVDDTGVGDMESYRALRSYRQKVQCRHLQAHNNMDLQQTLPSR